MPPEPVIPQPIPNWSFTGDLPFSTSAASGTVFQHVQSAFCYYKIIDWYNPGTVGGLADCTSTGASEKRIQLYFDNQATNSIYTWYPSGFSGCPSGASGTVSGGLPLVPTICNGVSAFQTWECMNVTVSSLDSSTGAGTSGVMHFNPGTYTRLATSADVEGHVQIGHNYVIIPTLFGPANEYVDDQLSLRHFANYLNVAFVNGDLPYIAGHPYIPDPYLLRTDANQLWETRMLC